MAFPIHRARRLRMSPTIRHMVRETALTPHDFILPLFVVGGSDAGTKKPIKSMPGCYHVSPDVAAQMAQEAHSVGIPGIILFGLPVRKDPYGSRAWADDGAVQRATREIKAAQPEICVICDTCLCEYTDHGHCGVLKDCTVDNDATLELLAKTAVSQARAGADMVAPSDMMDGRVAAIRRALDENGFINKPIMSYAAKYASSFYGPFREAAECAPSFGDRRGYQMDPGNAREAIREVALDIEEGADIVIVKPALPYLDIIKITRDTFSVPVAGYQVSGEYAQIKGAAAIGLVDEISNMMESLTSIKRAGADMIITYFAVDAAKVLAHQMMNNGYCGKPAELG
ncbi:delta-aminolevulinic acid dehydratase [Desulfosarcina ovata subsp. sediminis]|uniref:Delta-aminolevulinic acid dehydratase n=1 Tax=Desulfosarcina ovata subsp. sediminis TaxID=885957 RepID=A0A5K7ZG54_9BACT|nr:porphobilinogen synthase [Desulfosarcina ovata]BBO79891.1 delta-aminolevulinic acid dehydratase [Desulfosarcina ovata subsp. sediminis]